MLLFVNYHYTYQQTINTLINIKYRQIILVKYQWTKIIFRLADHMKNAFQNYSISDSLLMSCVVCMLITIY